MQQKAFAKASAAQRNAATKIIESLNLDSDAAEEPKPARRSLRDFFRRDGRKAPDEQDAFEVASENDG